MEKQFGIPMNVLVRIVCQERAHRYF